MPDIQVIIAGAAGEGIQTIGSLLAEVIQARGYAVMTWQEFESRIRGGVNRFCLRITKTPINAPRYKSEILLGLNRQAVEKYAGLVKADGVIFSEDAAGREDVIEIGFKNIAKQQFGKDLYANMVAIGALCAALDIDTDVVVRIVENRFAHKSDEIRAINAKAVQEGFKASKGKCSDSCPWSLPPQKNSHYLIGCHEAMAIAALYAGCRFISAYPMSPSTDIITHLSGFENDHPIFVEPAEDEIAAINMAIGAGFAGARAMTATSGGGFALMNEGLSLAGMTETPVVVIVAMRPGPATGLPTRTAQGDLLYSLFAGHGEFPKAVLCPADPLDAFHKTVKAFNLAEEFQIPVIVLTDQFLADSRFCFPEFPIKGSQAQNHLADPKAIDAYQRYQITDNGISPRLVPGQSPHLVGADSDEHDANGHITEDLGGIAKDMFQKRLAKLEGLRKAMSPPEQIDVDEAQVVLISWGSSRGAVVEAAGQLARAHNRSFGVIHFSDIWPAPAYAFPQEKTYLAVESNAGGQFQQMLKMSYGLTVGGHIRRFDGLPLSAEYILERYQDEE